MKIAYITNARIPTEKAHGTQIMHMCEAFAMEGGEVTLIVPERQNPITQDAFDFYHISHIFKIQKISNFDYFTLEKYIGVIAFYLQSISFLLKLSCLSLDKNTTVYTRSPEIAWLFGMRGYHIVYECHDWFKKSKNLALYFLRKTRLIVSTNTYIAQEFEKHGFSQKNLLVAPNGVSLEVFDSDLNKTEAVESLDVPRELKEKMKGNSVLIYTGSFLTMGVSKGIDEILDALKQLHKSNIVFIAVGGSLEDVLFYEKQAATKGISNAYFISRRSQSELALFQKSADILLMPFPKKAHYEYHMTPLKMFEYQVSKRPIIASDLPSIRQILNEKNCLFCEPGNSTDLALKIEYLLDHITIGEELALQAYHDVQEYTWQKRAKKILNRI